MAKILLIFHQALQDGLNKNILVCYYESLANELINNGNNVLLLNTNNIKKYLDKVCFNAEIENYISNKVKNYNPDLILSFNNQITEDIIANTNCPICCIEADTLDFFPNKDLIKKNIERYFYISYYKDFDTKKYLEIGFSKDKILIFDHATSVQNNSLEKVNNISFIGTYFPSLSKNIDLSFLDKKQYLNLRKQYNLNNYSQYEILETFCNQFTNNIHETYSMIDNRLNVLNAIWDLGLKLYGVRWNLLSNENLILKTLFDNTPKYSLQHNQDIYNSSIINLSISHPQCRGIGFPWRCYDIMASSGILISSYSENLKNKTKKYVNIPMYNSPYEARELCKYALENPNYVQDIILASNDFIEKEGRWNQNFQKLEELLNIKLLNINNHFIMQDTINLIEIPDKYIKHPKDKNNLNLAFKLLLTEIPIVKKLYPKHKKLKLYKKLEVLINNHD